MECLLSFGNRNGIQGRLVLILILMECLLRKMKFGKMQKCYMES